MADMASELEAVAFRLRRAGAEDLARELTAAMRRGVQPVPGRIRAGLKPKLPDRYAEVLDGDTDIKVTVSNDSSGANASASVVASNASFRKRRLNRLDQGILWHPLYGRFPRGDPRNRWFEQREPSVQPGWFTGPAEDAGPEVRAALEQALRDVTAKATSKGA
jgi:hypothetical protein